MKNWERIWQSRKDITFYVTHITKSNTKEIMFAYDVLKEILRCGYFKAGFGPRGSKLVGATRNTIKGSYPAVCFTEQPLKFISEYGIAVKKEHLYQYGGRPVIYNDETLLEKLPPEFQYLWVKYDPIPNPIYNYYPCDFTHEREWRCRPQKVWRNDFYWTIDDGIPILLPDDYRNNKDIPDFKILVRVKEEVVDLKEWISGLEPSLELKPSKYFSVYFERLRKARIISHEEIQERLAGGEECWSRLEDIPSE